MSEKHFSATETAILNEQISEYFKNPPADSDTTFDQLALAALRSSESFGSPTRENVEWARLARAKQEHDAQRIVEGEAQFGPDQVFADLEATVRKTVENASLHGLNRHLMAYDDVAGPVAEGKRLDAQLRREAKRLNAAEGLSNEFNRRR